MTRPRTVTAAILAGCLASAAAHADGGRIAWTGTRDDVPGTIVIAPMAPRVGVVRLDWVGLLPEQATAVVRARHAYAVEVAAVFEARGLEDHHATLELFAPGRWELAVDPDGDGPLEPVDLVIEIGGPLPAWRSQWPWLFSWVPVTALGWYAAGRRRSNPSSKGSPK